MSNDPTAEFDYIIDRHHARMDEIQKRNGRFVHYTSAEAAIKILKSKQLWMRDTRCMVDYMEVLHGCQFVKQFFANDAHQRRFCAAFPEGVGREVINSFDRFSINNQFNTYITSVAEHDDKEDNHGRLSMWRAFGRLSPCAAIVLKLPYLPHLAPSLLLRAVDYFNYDEIENRLSTIISDAQGLIGQMTLSSMDSSEVAAHVFYTLVTIVVSTKHEGFREEKEWRVIYMPELNRSPVVVKAMETIYGIPQIVYKIPLKDDVPHSVIGLEITQLIDRVIIGPSAFSDPIYEAFVVVLQEAGISDAEKRVVSSRIPLRA